MTISFRGLALALVVAFVSVWLMTYTVDSLAHSAGYFSMAVNAPGAVQATEQTRIIWDAQVQMAQHNRTWLWVVFWTAAAGVVLTSIAIVLEMVRRQS